jgi:hypothetical protein
MKPLSKSGDLEGLASYGNGRVSQIEWADHDVAWATPNLVLLGRMLDNAQVFRRPTFRLLTGKLQCLIKAISNGANSEL